MSKFASLAFAEDALDFDEYLDCVSLYHRQNQENRWEFDLEKLTDKNVVEQFRFPRDQLLKLCDLLEFPEWIIANNGSKIKGLHALCLLLSRLAYPQRLHDDEKLFGRARSDLSEFFNAALFHVHDKFGYLLTEVNQPWITEHEVRKWSDAITRKGSPFVRCIGFVDGTNIEICRQVQLIRFGPNILDTLDT